MPKCWTCGKNIEKSLYKCPACKNIDQINSLENSLEDQTQKLINVQNKNFQQLRDSIKSMSSGLENIASAINWGFTELNWKMQQQNNILKNIDDTLKTPNETQGNELRKMAESLLNRNVLDEAENKFLNSIEKNPLDYRSYVGIATLYLKKGDFKQAKRYLKKSLPHAPQIKEKTIKNQIAKQYEAGYTFTVKNNCKILIKNNHEKQIRENENALFRAFSPYQIILLSNNEWQKIYNDINQKKPDKIIVEKDHFFIIDKYTSKENSILKKYLETVPDFINHFGYNKLRSFSYIAVNFDNFIGISEPKNYRSYTHRILGHLEFCQDNFELAINHLNKACELSPDYGNAYYDYASYCAYNNKKEEAIKALKKAENENPLYLKLAREDNHFKIIKKEIMRIAEDVNNSEIKTSNERNKKLKEKLEKKLKSADLYEKYISKSTYYSPSSDFNQVIKVIKEKFDLVEKYKNSEDVINLTIVTNELQHLIDGYSDIAIKKAVEKIEKKKKEKENREKKRRKEKSKKQKEERNKKLKWGAFAAVFPIIFSVHGPLGFLGGIIWGAFIYKAKTSDWF